MLTANIGSVLGLAVSAESPIASIVRLLGDGRILLVLDNCEHVADGVAPLVEEVLNGTPNVHVLATSREPIRAVGEKLVHLSPLALPPIDVRLDAAGAMKYPSIQLFVEQAAASQESFQLSDADAEVVGDICRRVDGIPLAIELAANRVDMFGIRGLAACLDSRFLLTAQGRRTALPRHRTLSTMLDWSYEMLSGSHQRVLRRLAIFAGGFPLESALAIAAYGELNEHMVMDAIATLAAGSLLATDVSGDTATYRLLGVTRAYAKAKLEESDEHREVRGRHAVHLLDLFKIAEQEWLVRDRQEWLATYGRTIDDVRSALAWVFEPDGDAKLGVSLTAAWAPLGYNMSLLDEFRERIETALGWLDKIGQYDATLEIQLRSTLCHLNSQTRGANREIEEGFSRVMQLADASGSIPYKHDALMGMWVAAYGAGDYIAAGKYARTLRASTVHHKEPMAQLMADRMTAQVLHYLGDHHSAVALARSVMNAPVGYIRLALNSPVQVDRQVSMRIVISRALWIQGRHAEAQQTAADAVELARKDLVHSLSQALAMAAIPISIWSGNLDRADSQISELIEHSTRYSMRYWQTWAHHYRAILHARAERYKPANAAMLALPGIKLLDHLVTCQSRYANEAVVARVKDCKVGWCGPEVLRAYGENLLDAGDRASSETAVVLFRESLHLAQAHGARSWELRAALSLSNVMKQERRVEAASLLESVLDRMPADAEGIDISNARTLRNQLAS
jgi:predicted ATPase